MIFVDTNVLIDVELKSSSFAAWSKRALAEGGAVGPLVTDHVVFAELAPRFASASVAIAFLETYGVALVPYTDEAAFIAGKAHGAYRATGGPRAAILADFLIGGHATALGATLLTRDRQRFATYFPTLRLIAPDPTYG